VSWLGKPYPEKRLTFIRIPPIEAHSRRDPWNARKKPTEDAGRRNEYEDHWQISRRFPDLFYSLNATKDDKTEQGKRKE